MKERHLHTWPCSSTTTFHFQGEWHIQWRWQRTQCIQSPSSKEIKQQMKREHISNTVQIILIFDIEITRVQDSASGVCLVSHQMHCVFPWGLLNVVKAFPSSWNIFQSFSHLFPFILTWWQTPLSCLNQAFCYISWYYCQQLSLSGIEWHHQQGCVTSLGEFTKEHSEYFIPHLLL